MTKNFKMDKMSYSNGFKFNNNDDNLVSKFVNVQKYEYKTVSEMTNNNKSLEHDLLPLDMKIPPSVAETFRGLNIFITGSSGFMGKVLIEKLLRCCSDVGNIYLLMREKRGQSIKERLHTIINTPLFHRLHEEQGDSCFEKLVIVPGDVNRPNFGISSEMLAELFDKIHIVFHSAADVRFNTTLKAAILTNTKTAKIMAELAMKMTNLKVLVHLSTLYTNSDFSEIKEQIYPPKANYKDMIKMAETLDETTINALSYKLFGKLPNSYSFSKALGEIIMEEYSSKIPIVIIRPSIVAPTQREPIKGWVDNMNGPVGLQIPVLSGFMRVLYAKKKVACDFVSVDLAINACITSAWYRINCSSYKKCLVVNASVVNQFRKTISELIDVALDVKDEIPVVNMMWYPFVFATNNKYFYYASFLLLHLIPALIIDIFLKFFKQKLSLVKLYRKVLVTNELMYYYLSNNWKVTTGNYESLQNFLIASDYNAYNIDYFESLQYAAKNCILGGKLYVLKENPDLNQNIPTAKKNLKRMFYVHYATVFFLIFIFLYVCQDVPFALYKNAGNFVSRYSSKYLYIYDRT